MYTVLIVDDFLPERERLKSAVTKTGLDLQLVAECSDGRTAIDWLVSNAPPSIILADIEMPRVNGIELAEWVRVNRPAVKMVFLTHHDRFHYAQSAVNLKASAFLLKPVVAEELAEVLARMIGEMDSEDRLRRRAAAAVPVLRERALRDMLLGRTAADTGLPADQEVGLDVGGPPYAVLAVETDAPASSVREDLEKRLMSSFRLHDLIEGTMRESDTAGSVIMLTDRLHAVIFGLSHDAGADQLWQLADDLRRAAQGEGISLSIGIGPMASSFDTLGDSFRSASAILRQKFAQGPGRIISITDVGEQPDDGTPMTPARLEEVRGLVFCGSPAQAGRSTRNYLAGLPAKASPAAVRRTVGRYVVGIYLALAEADASFAEVYGEGRSIWEEFAVIDTRSALTEWAERLVYDATAWVCTLRATASGALTNRARQYIDTCYSNGINVQDVADHLSYSPNYLNSVFRQETGTTVLEYITERRVTRAKELLLQDAGTRVYEICEAVGYQHLAHFREVFTRHVGMTPRAYRDAMTAHRGGPPEGKSP